MITGGMRGRPDARLMRPARCATRFSATRCRVPRSRRAVPPSRGVARLRESARGAPARCNIASCAGASSGASCSHWSRSSKIASESSGARRTRRSSTAVWHARKRRRCPTSQLENSGCRSISTPSRNSPTKRAASARSCGVSSVSMPVCSASRTATASTTQSREVERDVVSVRDHARAVRAHRARRAACSSSSAARRAGRSERPTAARTARRV